ncbi:MAG: hypothetical protein FD153_410 [Rhodospirillaceae bacterium]|nr:MAG: hypothetical protein FD153_410 [Rhodospirillaceae bacterium]
MKRLLVTLTLLFIPGLGGGSVFSADGDTPGAAADAPAAPATVLAATDSSVRQNSGGEGGRAVVPPPPPGHYWSSTLMPCHNVPSREGPWRILPPVWGPWGGTGYGPAPVPYHGFSPPAHAYRGEGEVPWFFEPHHRGGPWSGEGPGRNGFNGMEGYGPWGGGRPPAMGPPRPPPVINERKGMIHNGVMNNNGYRE